MRTAILRAVASVMLALAAAAAMAGPIVVVTRPPSAGATIRVDGATVGRTGPDGTAVVEGDPGARRVEVETADGRRGAVAVEAGDLAVQALVSLAAPRPAAPVGGTALVLVNTNVGNAAVEVDGRFAGRTGAADGSLAMDLAAGAHRVRVSADGYEVAEQAITVRPGPVQRLDMQLRRGSAGGGTGGSSSGGLITWVLVGVLAIAVVAISVVVVSVARGGHGQKVTTKRIDRYEVREVLGRGGMATVYRATDALDRKAPPVALKVLDEGHLGDADLVRKFLREGEILYQLAQSDPEAPLVHVRHWGRVGTAGAPFIAMELVEGQNLLQLLNHRRRLSLRDAAHMVGGVARALVPAHAAGVYHRDLTPDNVILTDTPRGGYRLRLIDFGVARHEYTSHGTLDGSIAGKPPYMSPEQCQGVPVDARSDVYALGIMLYTLLVGHPPFTDRNPLEVMRKHKEDAVVYPAEVPEVARRVLERALAKDRERRQRDARELHAELLAVVGLHGA